METADVNDVEIRLSNGIDTDAHDISEESEGNKDMKRIKNSKLLYEASANGHTKEVERLCMDPDTDVNYRSEESTAAGCSPLIIATTMNNTSVVQCLLNHKADINLTDQYGNTPLHRVISKEMTELLIKNGADATLLNKSGSTPLHKISSIARGVMSIKEIAALLLQKNPDTVNISDESGNTPLHEASANLNLDLVDLLEISGADKTAKNNSGHSPHQVFRNTRSFSNLDFTTKNAFNYKLLPSTEDSEGDAIDIKPSTVRASTDDSNNLTVPNDIQSIVENATSKNQESVDIMLMSVNELKNDLLRQITEKEKQIAEKEKEITKYSAAAETKDREIESLKETLNQNKDTIVRLQFITRALHANLGKNKADMRKLIETVNDKIEQGNENVLRKLDGQQNAISGMVNTLDDHNETTNENIKHVTSKVNCQHEAIKRVNKIVDGHRNTVEKAFESVTNKVEEQQITIEDGTKVILDEIHDHKQQFQRVFNVDDYPEYIYHKVISYISQNFGSRWKEFIRILFQDYPEFLTSKLEQSVRTLSNPVEKCREILMRWKTTTSYTKNKIDKLIDAIDELRQIPTTRLRISDGDYTKAHRTINKIVEDYSNAHRDENPGSLSDEGLLDLAKQIPDNEWMDLGIKLKFRYVDLTTIEANFRGNRVRCKMEMLIGWRRRQAGPPDVMFCILASALIDSKLADLAKSLRSR